MSSKNSVSVAATYLRWTFLRAILHRGWWLAASLYFVTEANLSPLEIVLLGTAQGLTVIIFEVPAGIVADNYSRKWSIVLSQVLMGLGMLTTGLVTSFPALVATQMIWGLSWTFASGADVAWVNDELDAPQQIGPLLARAASWNQWGSVVGIAGLGLLAWLSSLALAMVLAGAMMLVLGAYVAWGFTERNFTRAEDSGLSGLRTTLRKGAKLVASDRSIAIILAVTFLINGADEVFSRLLPKELLELGLPTAPDPVLWLTALGLVTLCTGAIVLHIVQNRMSGEPALRVLYGLACCVGGAGILLFSVAPNHWVAMAGAILVHGIAWNVARLVSVVWVNGRSQSRERATLQSFLSQVENLGEVVIGASLAVIAQSAGIPFAFLCASIVVFAALGLIVHLRTKS